MSNHPPTPPFSLLLHGGVVLLMSISFIAYGMGHLNDVSEKWRQFQYIFGR